MKDNYVKPGIDVLCVDVVSICAGTDVNIGIGGTDDGGDGPVAKENSDFYGGNNCLWDTSDTME